MKRVLEQEENGRDKRWEKQKLELELKKKLIDKNKKIISRPRLANPEIKPGFLEKEDKSKSLRKSIYTQAKEPDLGLI